MSSQTRSLGAAITRVRETRGSGSVALDAAKVAHEQQVLQVRAHRREAFEVLDRLLAPGLASGAKRRANDLLKQRRLAVGRAPEDAQVPARHAEARELRGRAHDLEIRLVVDHAPVAALRLDDAELLELADQVLRNAGLIEDLLERERRHGGVDRCGAPRRCRLAAATGAAEFTARELLADDPERKELIPLHAEDRAQALDIGLTVETVAAGRAARRQELLILEVPDLGDLDVVELLAQDLGHGSDRQRLAGARRRIVGRGTTLRLPAALGSFLGSCDRHLSAPGSSACTSRSGSRRRRRLDAAPVHVGPVERSQVVDVEAVLAPNDQRVVS